MSYLCNYNGYRDTTLTSINTDINTLKFSPNLIFNDFVKCSTFTKGSDSNKNIEY